jgi:hypothetical protein
MEMKSDLLDNIVGEFRRRSRDICITNRKVISELEGGFERDESARINVVRNDLSHDRVERLDNFLHGIAHSGYLSKKTRPLSALLESGLSQGW